MPSIVHIADVHWRGLTRHQEYRDIFERYFTQIKVLNPDIIYIGGDIVHSKTQGISPELIDNLVWWFQSLADIAPTHVILGNHDGILLNKDRQDAISPIVKAINHPNLFLYKETGVYPTGHEGFNWCVFSCFDEENWENLKPVPDEVNIALFHGAVWGSKTDIDWDIEGEVEVPFFKDYEFALLGDIHRCQFLTPDKRIAYCGSSIQQNYGEDRSKGFLYWDIRAKDDFDVEFHAVEGTKPFITVDWKGSVPLTLDSLASIPDNSRLRIRTNESIPSVEWKQLCNELEIAKSPAEIVSKDEHVVVDTQQISTDTVSLFKNDLQEAETHVQLLKEYFRDADLSDEDWAQLTTLTKKYINTIIKTGLQKSVKWSVKKLEFDNTFAYGKNNVIDFENLSGITGIFGRNARGKSSVVGSLMYTLFNTTDRGPIKNIHVINSRKSHCIGKVTIGLGEERLRIERQSVKHKDKRGKESAVTHLNVFKVDENGNVLVDRSGEQRRVTENNIREQIGNSEDFLLTSLASQGEMNSFIKQRSTARKSVLTRFLGLDIFEKMAELAREESKLTQAQIKTAPDRDWDVAITGLILDQRQLREKIQEIERKITNFRLDEQKVQIRLSTFENADVITPADVERQKKVITASEKTLETHKKNKINFEKEIKDINKKINRIESVKNQISIDVLRQRQASLRSLESSLVKMKHSHERAFTLLQNQSKSVKKLKDVPCGDKFPTCKFIKDSHNDKKSIDSQKEKVEDLMDQLKVAESHLAVLKLENVGEQIKKYEALLKLESELIIKVTRKEADVKNVNSDIRSVEGRIERAKSDLEELESKTVDSDVNDELNLLKSQVHSIRQKISVHDAQRMSAASEQGSFETKLNFLKEEKIKYQEIKQKWRIFDLFMQGVSKKGIPLQIITSQLPVINSEIAKILQSVVSFTIELEADPDSNAMDVYINYGDSRRIIELASGMEKMVASLAIRVALINVSSLPKTDMLVIDEGFGSLDDVNVEACNRLLVSLKKWFKTILIITHIDGVKDVADNVIDITWNGKDAKVVYK